MSGLLDALSAWLSLVSVRMCSELCVICPCMCRASVCCENSGGEIINGSTYFDSSLVCSKGMRLGPLTLIV